MANHKKGFSWLPGTGQVKTKTQIIDLRAEVTPNMGSLILKIDTERELQYTNELGWNWHKSWNIPNLSIKLILDQDENAQFQNCHVQLMGVKQLSQGFYEEVGLEGITQQDIIDGKAFFSGVKFNSTTYNHQGRKFQLLILLKSQENLIVVLESPSIFVDSRKSARDEHRQIQYQLPFDPNYLERNFCKKEKHFNDVVQAPIENNENGLHNYLTAPNIRNKIKHPLFLTLKFSKCISIYYQKTLIVDNYLIEFQKQLMQKQGESQYIISFQSNNNRIRKKIEESLSQLFLQSKVKVIERKYVDESIYQKLEFDLEDYKQSFQGLQQIMNSCNQENNEDIIQPLQIQQSSEIQYERKSAFKKFTRDFEKLPTKNFNDLLENKDELQKKIKIEENVQQSQQMLQWQNIVLQNQLFKYYLMQQQQMINFLSQQS